MGSSVGPTTPEIPGKNRSSDICHFSQSAVLCAPGFYVECVPQALACSTLSLEKLFIVSHDEPPRRLLGSPRSLSAEARHGTRHLFRPGVSSRTARSRYPAGHAEARLQPQVPAALSRCLAGLPQLHSLLPDSRGPLRALGRAIPRQPRHPHGGCPGRVNGATTPDPSRDAHPGRVQPARLLSAPVPHRAEGVPLGSSPDPAGHVPGVLQESPPLHAGHPALPDTPPHPIPPLLGSSPGK